MQKRMDDNPQDMLNRLRGDVPENRSPNIDNILKIVAAKIESMRESQEEQENKFEDMLEAMGMDYDEMDEEDERNIRIVRDDKDSPEYGNSYTDWSPNLDDYLT
jgi:hypothetical protein